MTPVIKISLPAEATKKGSADIRRELKRIVADHQKLQTEFKKPIAVAGIQQAARSSQQFEQATTRVASAQQRTNTSVVQGQRALLQLQSSLGGAERASSQMTIAQQRLEQAQKAGLVTSQRAIALQGQMRSTFSATAVTGRDLRTNMAGMNSSMTTMAGSMRSFTGTAIQPLATGLAQVSGQTGAVGTALSNLVTVGLNPATLAIVGAVAAVGFLISKWREASAESEAFQKSLDDQLKTLQRLNKEFRLRSGIALPGDESLRELQATQAPIRERLERKLADIDQRLSDLRGLELRGPDLRGLEGLRDRRIFLESQVDLLDAAIDRQQRLNKIERESAAQSTAQRSQGTALKAVPSRVTTPSQIAVDPLAAVAIGIRQRAAERDANRPLTTERAVSVGDEGFLIFLEEMEAARIADTAAAAEQAMAANSVIEKLREEAEAMAMPERERFIAQQLQSIDLTALEAASRDKIIQKIREEADALFSVNKSAKDAQRVQQEFQSIAQSTFSSILRDAASFEDILENMALRIGDLVVEMLIIRPLMKGLFGESGTGGLIGGLLTSLTTSFFAASKGAVTTGLPVNTIISRPTLFPTDGSSVKRYAQGGILAGEEGEEAIMPLSRGPGGRLGVEASGGRAPTQIVNVYNNAPGVEVSTQTRERGPGRQEIDIMIDERVAGIIRSGGKTTSAMERRFGLNRIPAGR